ncbi:unnamed protein product [Staurois parvus]|uniref:Uncharacterized protein n=1 Tax=Staurois parvus TaxID=386267 RepID=A0ABN9AF71_9NEOB|nr:unnamed protein product [Staurois parvus]
MGSTSDMVTTGCLFLEAIPVPSTSSCCTLVKISLKCLGNSLLM